MISGEFFIDQDGVPTRGGVRIARVVLINLVFAIVLAIGFIELQRASRESGWKPVECEILASRIDRSSDKEAPYAPRVRFRYLVGGKSFVLDKPESGGDKTSDADEVCRTLVAFRPGKSTCYVNPNDSSEAV